MLSPPTLPPPQNLERALVDVLGIEFWTMYIPWGNTLIFFLAGITEILEFSEFSVLY